MSDIHAEGAFDGFDEAFPPDTPWKLVSAETIARDGVAPITWDIEGIAERDSGPIIIYGLPETLKSWLALYVARCMVTGEPFAGRFRVTPRPCAIYLNFDAGATAMRRRVAKTTSSENFYVESPGSWDPEKFEDILRQHPGAFVVIDCLADIFSAAPNQEPGEAMRKFVRGLRGLFERYGCSGIVVDHAKRPDDIKRSIPSYYGNVQKKAAVRQMWSIDRIKEGDRLTNRITMRCEKASEADRFDKFELIFDLSAEPLAVSFVDESRHGKTLALSPTDTHRREILARVEALGEATRAQLGVSKDGGGKRKAVFKDLVKEGLVLCRRQGNRIYYTRQNSGVNDAPLPEILGHPSGHPKNGSTATLKMDGQEDGRSDGQTSSATPSNPRKVNTQAGSRVAGAKVAIQPSQASSREVAEAPEEARVAEFPDSIGGHHSWPPSENDGEEMDFEP